MILKKITLLFLMVFAAFKGFSQTCNRLGQNPATAFEVCGTGVFPQGDVPVCGGRQIFTPDCTDDILSDKNPFWYRFTCFTSGTLGFLITPVNMDDDYDWQLFDITDHINTPDDLYSHPSMTVCADWSGISGLTGTSNAGISSFVCGTPFNEEYRNPFAAMPQILEGHVYILLISHYSGSDQSGYNLSFGGGTASITDTKEPALASARAICDGVKMSVKLNKKMRCSSLNLDGSDFIVTPAVEPIISAEGINCSNGIDMDSVVLTLAGPLPPGNYTVTIQNDISGINLLDICGRTIPAGQSLPVTVFPQIATPMDSLTKIGCAPDELYLVFSKPMMCNSVAADGSDFTVTGPILVTVASAAGVNCSTDGLSSTIRIKLSAPIQTAGTYRITLRTGSDGNTVKNECAMETAAGSFINFTAVDTVNAEFTYNIHLGCKTDVIDYSHDGRNNVNYWKWTFDNNISSNKKDTSISYTVFNNKTTTLVVSNGVCRDSFTNNTILLDNFLDAVFESTSVVCPGDPALFKNKSYNRVTQWRWQFGNGNTSSDSVPAPQYYPVGNNNSVRDVPTRLIVTNDIGCSDTASSTIRVVGNCFIAVPTAFSPNGDGMNDYLFPTNAYKARDLYFAVFNRNGNKIFETRDWTNKWDGTFKGNPQDPGTYVWFLYYTHIETGNRMEQKGTTVLLR